LIDGKKLKESFPIDEHRDGIRVQEMKVDSNGSRWSFKKKNIQNAK
jgi:hypothetical protein